MEMIYIGIGILIVAGIFVLGYRCLAEQERTLLIGVVYGLACVVAVAPLWNVQSWWRYWADKWNLSANSASLLLCLAGILWLCLIFVIARLIIGRFIIQWMDEQKKQLNDFQDMVSSTLDEDKIYDSIVETVGSIFPVAAVRIRIRKPNREVIRTVRDTIFSDSQWNIKEAAKDIPGQAHLSKIEPIRTSGEDAIAKTWDSEAVIHIGEIRYNKKIWGYIDLCTCKGERFRKEDEIYFDQLCSYASIALKNARLYQQAYEDSITDSMTGLYNRKYALDTIVGYFPKEGQASLIYLELDDLKLYNELYSTEEGDRLIIWFSRLMREMSGTGKVFRYGSNEFLIHLPDMPVKQAYEIAESVRRRVEVDSHKEDSKIHAVTISAGVAEYPEIAPVLRKLIGYAQRGAFYAKKNGKNKVMVYSRNLENREETGNSYAQIAPTVYALTAAIDAKDSYTFVHSQKVSEYASILGEAVGLHQDEILTLKQAGMLHDIGKIGIPESILKKTGRLTEEEYRVMKTHVNNSIKMIRYLPDMNYVIPAVVSHHERYDGQGYPEQLKGEDIPYLGRILSIADSFDAMTARRPYKPPLSLQYAMNEIEKNAGTQFDPSLAAVFVQLIKEGKIQPENAQLQNEIVDVG